MDENYKQEIPIFFAADDNYIPFLAVSIESMLDHISSENMYIIKILETNISEENKKNIKKYSRENVSIEFVNLTQYVEKIKDKLYTRDYYSKTTYFRLFIPELYKEYDKVLYLDCDITVLSDIADLYNTTIGDNLIAAAPDDVIQTIEVFQDYAEKVVGVSDYRNYFNAGVILMNLDELRKFSFQEKFMYLLNMVKFSVAQDQDYLNRLCKGRVLLVPNTWNRMPIGGDTIPRQDLHLIHYNLAFKTWHFENILYKEYFWEYAKKTIYFDKIKEIQASYSEEDRKKDKESDTRLRALAQKECDCVGDDRLYKCSLDGKLIPKSKDRLEIIEKIRKFEREGLFDKDVENDPPTIVLTPEHVDYLNKKESSKFKTRIANRIGKRFLEELLRSNKLIIKEIHGMENLNGIDTGVIITCNHFNPYDSFAVERVFELSRHADDKKLYKVIREGNYTNFPGFYGFLFRNCDTLPLSSNRKTMVEFLKAVDILLKKGEFILVYPEQSMWWNYKKPKPLKDGAFKFAIKSNVPVLPIFITMKESKLIGDDGFPIMEYYMNIEKPIYPNPKLSDKENVAYMRDTNFDTWKKVYENFYNIPLEYSTLKKENKEDKKEA